MELFNFSSKEKIQKPKKISFSTTDIPKAYEYASKKLKISVENLDFKLLKVSTFIKPEKELDFEPISKKHASILKSKESLLDPEIKFKQIYKVIFAKKVKQTYFLKTSLEVNRSRTLAKVKVLKFSIFPKSNELKKWLIYEINKFKIEHKILLFIFDWDMKKEIDKLYTYLSKHEKLVEDVSIPITRWPAGVKLTVDDKFILHYKRKEKAKKERVDHAEQKYSNFIKANALLAEYIKPRKGQTGRNFEGILVEDHEPIVENEPMFNMDEASIDIKEDEKSIKYFSKKPGYVFLENGEFKIEDNLQIDSIDLKSTGNISSNIEKNISITIKGDAVDDKIGPNMKVEVASLNIGGSIAEGAEIKSKNLKIGGQTHSTSKITTEQAEIKVHKGHLEAIDAKITALEGGTIFADNINIEMAISAYIHGKDIYIKELKSHCEIEFTNSLVVDKLSGEENQFIVTSKATLENKKNIEKLLSDIKKIKLQLPIAQKEFDLVIDRINKDRSNLEQLKNSIEELKKTDTKPSPVILKRFTELTEIKDSAPLLEDELKKLQAKLDEYMLCLDLYQDMMLNASISMKSVWHGYNQITFHMINPKQIVRYSPSAGSGPEKISIKLNSDKEYEIIKELIDTEEEK